MAKHGYRILRDPPVRDDHVCHRPWRRRKNVGMIVKCDECGRVWMLIERQEFMFTERIWQQQPTGRKI